MRKRFHQYCLTKQIANKSSSSVYLAYHVSNATQKVLLEILDATSFTFNQQDEKIFQKIKLIKQLKHSSIVPIMDLGIERGQPYVVREYHTYESLRHLLDNLFPQRLNLQEALAIIRKVGQALSYAHQYQIVHGRITPETIFLKSNGEVLLSDFGLANFIDITQPSQKSNLRTISYMAPEQFAGSLTEKSDQYSLACLAYELITGCVPFSDQSTFSAIMPISAEQVSEKTIKTGKSGKVVLGQAGSFCENSECPDYGKAGKGNVRKYGRTRKGAQRWRCKTCQTTWSTSSTWAKYHLEFLIPPSDLVPDLPRPIQEVVLKAMAKDPSDRYSTVSLFLEALEGALFSTSTPQMGPSFSTFAPTVTEESLEDLENDMPSPTQLNEASMPLPLAIKDYHSDMPLTVQLNETPPPLHLSKRSGHISNKYESGKTLLTAGRLSHSGPSPTPTFWLAFALSGIVLLLGTMLLYVLVPLRLPASINPVQSHPTVSIAATTTPTYPVDHMTPTIQLSPVTRIGQFPITATSTVRSIVQTVTFDDLPQTDHSLSGQYPTGVIDWGQNTWEVMPPSAYNYPSNVIQFANQGMVEASFTFLQPEKLLQFMAYNGGGNTTVTVTLSCAGLPNVSAPVSAEKVVTIQTGWTTACTTPTLHSPSGWNMLFDNFEIASL